MAYRTARLLAAITFCGFTCLAAAQSVDTDREAVERAIAAWTDAVNANDMAALLAVVSEDMEMVPPGAPPASGEQARQLIRGFFDPYVLALTGETYEILISGDIAIRRYRYELTLTPKDGGDAEVSTGQGMHVLQRDARGDWLFIKDIWNDGS